MAFYGKIMTGLYNIVTGTYNSEVTMRIYIHFWQRVTNQS
jgi:hypothetical protein